MTDYTAAGGRRFTDEDIERWAAADESAEGYTGEHLGPPMAGTPDPPAQGRPISVGADARPLTIRLDAARRAKLEAAAAAQRTTVSQLVRSLIDGL